LSAIEQSTQSGILTHDFSDNENVVLTSGERVVYRILDVNNVETSIVTLTVGDDTNTTHVTTTGSHGNDTSVKLDEISDLASGKVNLDGIVDLNGWVWVSNTVRRLVSISVSFV
jgi:hypothetical protein